MEYILGIDIGTSGCKCVLLDQEGKPIITKSKEYFPITKADGTVEQNPNEWYEAAIFCLNQINKLDKVDLKKIVAVSVTGQMQGITLIGKDGNPVRNSILWNDIRSERETNELNKKFGEIMEKTIGFLVTPALTVSKIAWLKEHEPSNWNKTYQFTFAPNFITYKLTDRIIADENNISFSGLNDVKNNCWSDELIRRCEVEKSKIPELTGCFDMIGNVTERAALETGLQEGIPVVAGGGDGGSEKYSIGIEGMSKMIIRLGSAADIGMVVHVDQFKHQDIWPGIRGVMRDYLIISRYTTACAASIKWMRDVFFSELPADSNTYTVMDKEASTVPLGSEGLLYHPYLSGENAPYFNSSLRAKFNGINSGHRRKHFLRAAYEGVSFSIRDVINSVKEFENVQEVFFVGGGTKSKFWVAVLTDVLGKGATIPQYCDAAYGAALMAGQGAGIWDARSKIERNLKNSIKVGFNEENHQKYNEVFKKYMELAGK
jgi:xylulokinase